MLQGSMFSAGENKPEDDHAAPLAARMRPTELSELLGQAHVIGEGSVLRRAIDSDRLPSLILWGPPGSGKTTLARIIARSSHATFCPVSAVTAGVADLRRIVDDARKLKRASGRRTILFIDEIHRFNKAQQDVILPHVEDGVVTLIGATTENPSFEVNAALLSRCRVCTLHRLSQDDIKTIVDRALRDQERGLGILQVSVAEDALAALLAYCDGDARVALNVLELAAQGAAAGPNGKRQIDLAAMQDAMQHKALLYDKSGDQHFDTISALHKCVRDSDPDAALYWLGRMIEAGEDPLYLARRLVRAATEDIGMADPQALPLAMAAQQAVHFLGMPEGNLALAEITVYLALAPKSNALYRAYGKVQHDVASTRNEPVPLQIRNAATRLMKDLGYGKDYKYAHDYLDKPNDSKPEGAPRTLNENLPPSLKGKRYYEPTSRGFERELRRRLGLQDSGSTEDSSGSSDLI